MPLVNPHRVQESCCSETWGLVSQHIYGQPNGTIITEETQTRCLQCRFQCFYIEWEDNVYSALLEAGSLAVENLKALVDVHLLYWPIDVINLITVAFYPLRSSYHWIQRSVVAASQQQCPARWILVGWLRRLATISNCLTVSELDRQYSSKCVVAVVTDNCVIMWLWCYSGAKCCCCLVAADWKAASATRW